MVYTKVFQRLKSWRLRGFFPVPNDAGPTLIQPLVRVPHGQSLWGWSLPREVLFDSEAVNLSARPAIPGVINLFNNNNYLVDLFQGIDAFHFIPLYSWCNQTYRRDEWFDSKMCRPDHHSPCSLTSIVSSIYQWRWHNIKTTLGLASPAPGEGGGVMVNP